MSLSADRPLFTYAGPEGARPVPESQHYAYGCSLGPKDPKRRPLYNEKGEKVHGALFNDKPMSMGEAADRLAKLESGGLPPKRTKHRQPDGRATYSLQPRKAPPARRWVTVLPKRGGAARPRQRRGGCNSRPRGSRRSTSRSSSRGGDSGDGSDSDADGDHPLAVGDTRGSGR